MASLMFWNVGRQEAGDAIADLCREHEVDVLLLAEVTTRTTALLRHLNDTGRAKYREFRPAQSRVRVFTRYPRGALSSVFDDGHVSIRSLRPPTGLPILIVAAHLPSKLWTTEGDQYYRLRQLRQDITRAETHAGHQNTIVIGDLNVNPFEDAIVAADGLHGVMDKRTAQRPARTVRDRSWDFFYNPMWSRLGDESSGPPGTYYRPGSGLVSYFWNTFDQVLLRPNLLPYYDARALIVVTRVGERDILGEGAGQAALSDHLPLVVKLSLETET